MELGDGEHSMKKLICCLTVLSFFVACNTEYPSDYKGQMANSSAIQMEKQILAMIDESASEKYVDALFDAYKSNYPNYNDLCNASSHEIENIRINTMKSCVKYSSNGFRNIAINLAENSPEICRLKNSDYSTYNAVINNFAQNLNTNFDYSLENFIEWGCRTPQDAQRKIEYAAQKAMKDVEQIMNSPYYRFRY